MVSRRSMLATGVGLAVGTAAAGCGSASAKVVWGDPGSTVKGSSPSQTVKVTITPAESAKDVVPSQPVVISAEGGTIQTVTVVAGTKNVAGSLSADQRSWQSTAALDYNQTYTVNVSATTASGQQVQQSSTFTTLKPTATATATFQANALAALKSGGTYGVGQPIIVAFNTTIKDRAAALQAIEVVTQPAVQGRWRWINNKTAHWRPEKYWASGTKITVKVNIFGVLLGNNVYGAANASTQFTIGPSRIAIADNNSHIMQCYIDGALARSIPVSLGKGGTNTTADGASIHYWTNNGPHVVLTKEGTVRMTSGSYGVKDKNDPNYYDEDVKLCTRISYSGEFVHLADWNVSAHGRTNTSHGCINVGPSHAQWFYDTFQPGDIVDVKNSPKPLAVDNGLGDWTVSWADW